MDKDSASQTIGINFLLKLMVEKKASDLFITAGFSPSLKINGRLFPVGKKILSSAQTRTLAYSVMDVSQRDEFERDNESNFAISKKQAGRFRISAFYQRNQVGMVIRRIESQIPQLDELALPEILKDLAMVKRGLVIVVGGTGTGKSTSLAAMIGHRNEHGSGHILSIEDPIEFVHDHKKSIVTQREVGIDTKSFEVALKNSLRQAPDVIMIGEVRSRETMEYALTFAETGHLCLATLHANNANQALDRIIHFFPADRHSQIWMDLSLNLKGVVAQQLVKTRGGKRRRAAVEVLLNTPLVQETIRQGDVYKLKAIMAKSKELGMQTFDHALYALYDEGEITYEEAISHADAPNDMRLLIKLASESDADYLDDMADKLSLQHEGVY
ncbi:type IV pili twitching motility protein PilT [Endozoicomonas sp. (ex Bugula neritina AB1)]|nr:type IV pili twitching motility protein PilT [Endozoicomonas sp. (ex Bugula neritina AB1)]